LILEAKKSAIEKNETVKKLLENW